VVNVETEIKYAGSKFITAKAWREMDTEDILKSIEIATRVIKDDITSEWLGEPTEVGRVAQLLDIGMKFQELAMEVLKGIAEGYAHL
jgi:hypothetical protein